MLLSAELVARIAGWDELKRWEKRELGQDLRRLGLSYREIGQLIAVPKGTLSAWCCDLPLTEEQREALRSRRPDLARRREIGARLRQKAKARATEIRMRASAEACTLLCDPVWVAGVVAYWGEGAKRQKEVVFSNSDRAMIRLFIAWSARYLGAGPEGLTARMHLHSGQDANERRAYWSAVTGIPLSAFRKTFTKPEGTGHRKNDLYNGTLLVRISRSGDLFHRVMGWIECLADRYRTLG